MIYDLSDNCTINTLYLPSFLNNIVKYLHLVAFELLILPNANILKSTSVDMHNNCN